MTEAPGPPAHARPSLRHGGPGDGGRSPAGPLRLLLPAAIALPLLVTAAGAWLSWRQAWSAAEQDVMHAASASSEYARRLFDTLVLRVDRANDMLAGLTDAEIAAREAELHAALRRTASAEPRNAAQREPYIFVYDREAHPLVSGSVFPVLRDRAFLDREFNTALRGPGAPPVHVSPVYVGSVTGEPFFALTRRRERSGNGLPPDAYDGVVNASVYVREAEETLQRLAPEGDVLSLVRSDGAVLARSIPVPPGTQLGADSPMRAALRAGAESIVLDGHSPLDGQARIVAYRRVEGYPVYASAARPRAAVVRRWSATVLPLLLAAGIPATFALVGLALQVRRSQRALTAANSALEQRVAARTAALEASERRNAEVLESIGEPLCSLDPAGRVAYASASALAFWDLPAEAVLGRRFDDLFPQGVGSVAWLAKREAAERREEIHLCTLSPIAQRWIELDIYPRADGGLTIAFRDVHDRRTAERERISSEAALRHSEGWLRLAHEAAGIGAWELDLATGLRRWSDGTCRLWGLEPGDPMPLAQIMTMVHPEDRALVESRLAEGRAQRSGRLPELELRILRASDGAERRILSWGEVVPGPDGRPLRHLGVMQDVTQRRAAEAALRAGDARLKAAIAGARLGLWERHLPSATGSWDARACEIYGGLRPEQCSPDLAEWRERVHPDDRAARIAAIEAAVAPGGPDSYAAEFRFRREDGGWNRVSIHGTVVERDPVTGRGVRLAGVAQDLTEQHAAEAALRSSEERLRLAQEAGGVGSWEWTIETGALHWSESCHRLHGTDPGEPPRYEAWLAGIHPEDRPRVADALRVLAEGGGEQWEIEFRFIRPRDGAQRWIVGRGRVVRDPATGQPQRLLGVALDVTERRRAEERLMLLAREVDHRAKNALAVVQAAVRLAPKHDAEAFARAVEGRVGALARAQVLLAEAGWQGAALRTVAEGALGAFLPVGPAPAEGVAPRTSIEGPPVQLGAGAAQPISLALHELATNAAKYGALSTPEGRVRLAWQVDAAAGRLRLLWQESGGPALAEPPSRRGFGSRVIEATIRDQLGGTVERRWEAGGLTCEMAMPLARVVAEAPARPAAAD